MMIEILEEILFGALKKAQDEYMKDHILNPNPEKDWRDDRSWR